MEIANTGKVIIYMKDSHEWNFSQPLNEIFKEKLLPF